ncbi:MAG: bifunctional riboflavin kinase/FMN adenylyltransferase [Cloacibacillus sp.]|nr:bifunctional riboflavin kinase/FMN adenylyltransferase [Cloacibacillus sp.]
MIYALGAFDGFHLGHRRLLEMAKRESAQRDTGWGVITFEGHPRMLLNRDNFKLLFTPPERDLIARYLGIPRIEKIHFTHEFAALEPREFVDYIAEKYNVDGLVIGENFRFGRGRSGTPAVLAELARERGWSLDGIPAYKFEGRVWSSTATREAVLAGERTLASELLGYPFIISGRVVQGEARGRLLGYRTANISVKEGKIYPPHGVYAAISYIEGEWRGVALNIGSNPTFDDVRRAPRCEAHVIDFHYGLYDSLMRLFIIGRIRGEKKFACAEELVGQIGADVEACSARCERYIAEKDAELGNFASVL